MPLVPEDQVTTEEVKGWQGVHLLFFDYSLCSRKVKLVLELKRIPFTERRLSPQELRTPWYLGINPRGLVPALVDDGAVVIESNDILAHLEARFPALQPRLMAAAEEDSAAAAATAVYLQTQDGYHMDIRTLTFKQRFPAMMLVQMAKAKVAAMDLEESIAVIQDVAGAGGQGRAEQRAWYAAVVAQRGIPDTQVADSVARLRTALAAFDADYATREYLVGGALSMADVAIWVDFERLLAVAPRGSFAPAQEFPALAAAFDRLAARVSPPAAGRCSCS